MVVTGGAAMTALRVMTWNVQNLFDPGTPDGPKTQGDFDAKIASLSTVINQVAPHLLALQEVGDDPVLDDLQAALSPAMPHKLVGLPDSRGIRVALLSTRVLHDRVDVVSFP